MYRHFIFEWVFSHKFLLISLGNAIFAIFAMDASMVPIKHIYGNIFFECMFKYIFKYIFSQIYYRKGIPKKCEHKKLR